MILRFGVITLMSIYHLFNVTKRMAPHLIPSTDERKYLIQKIIKL